MEHRFPYGFDGDSIASFQYERAEHLLWCRATSAIYGQRRYAVLQKV